MRSPLRARAVGGKRLKLDVAGRGYRTEGFPRGRSGCGVEEPLIGTRRLGSPVTLAAGEATTFVDLLSEVQQQVEDRVPFFAELALLGRQFRKAETIVCNVELIMMVTPGLLDPAGKPITARKRIVPLTTSCSCYFLRPFRIVRGRG